MSEGQYFSETERRRFQPYAKYKDSGVEWLGEIPAHWDVKPFKALLSRNDSGVWGEDFSDDGVIVLRSTEQTVDGEWNIKNPAKRRLTTREASDARLKVGDLVVTKSSGSELHIGKTSIVDTSVSALNCCFSNFMQRLRVAWPNLSRYCWYLLNCPVAREQLVFLSSTTTGLGNLNGSILGSIRVTVAPDNEQQAIAAFLDREIAKIDTLRAKKERLIELLQEKRTALITQAVTKGLDPNVPMKESGVEWLGDVPIAWNLLRLKHIVQFLGGGTPSKDNLEYWQGDIPWVSPKDMKSWIVSDTVDKITEEAVAGSATKVVGPDTVLIVVRSGILNHTIPVALSGSEVALNQDLKALKAQAAVVPEYLAYFIAGMQSPLLFAWRKEGATVESLELDLIANTLIPLPPVSQQRIIVNYLKRETATIDVLTAKINVAIERLKEYRTALISAAVTGKIDVRDEVRR
jgi:type I restriction enzyme S subunit